MASARCNPECIVYLQAYFVTIATILGTGILGLPVTLSNSGLLPFLVTFILDALAQSLLVCFFVDLLQRAIAAQHKSEGDESMPLNAVLEEDMVLVSDDDMGDEDASSNAHFTGAIMKGKMLHIREMPSLQAPNLHLLGKLFLGCGMAQAFDLIIILQFVALLICYSLAGSEAFAQLVEVDHFYIIPAFVWTLTAAIIFAMQLIKPFVSILTFVKGILLLGTAMVTFYVGMTVAETISNDFAYVGAPFLMGTVAIGGVINTMPYTFEKISYKKKQISQYHLAVQMGLWTCVLLNIVWCWTVLEIVPQTIAAECTSGRGGFTILGATNSSQGTVQVCSGELSLEGASARGEISTIPLTRLLQRDHPSFTWVAILIEIFILVSISVSYLTIGTALHHTLCGIVQSVMVKRRSSKKIQSSKKTKREWCIKTGVSLVAFVLVFAVAMLDPQGFVDILEKLVSFTLNVEVGLFVFVMVICSRRGIYKNLEIPLPMPEWVSYLLFILPLFFNFAVVYDIYSTVVAVANPTHHSAIKINTTSKPQGTNSSWIKVNLSGNSSTGEILVMLTRKESLCESC